MCREDNHDRSFLLDQLLAGEPDPAVRRDLLARFVDGAYATVMRQAYFVLFEREAHELIAAGETTGVPAERYMANLEDQFGDALELSDEFRWEWVSISHIYDRPSRSWAMAAPSHRSRSWRKPASTSPRRHFGRADST